MQTKLKGLGYEYDNGTIFFMNWNCTVIKFRRYHTWQNLGGIHICIVRLGNFSLQKGTIIYAGNKFEGSSAVIRFCMMN